MPKRADLLQRLHELTIQLGDYERWLQPLVQAIDEHELLLDRSTERSFETAKLELRAVVARINLEQPAYIVSGLRSKLATCVAQLRHSAFAHLTGQRQRLFACIARLREYSPQQRLAQADMRLQSQVDRFDRAIRQLLSTKGSALDHLDTRLDALSPLSVLERGFAIAYCGGQVVRDAKQVSTGMELDVRVHRGIISAIVNESKALK